MADIGLNFWLTAWIWEPSILIGTTLIVGLYLYAVGPLRKRYHLAERVKRSQVVYFLLGVFLMFLALVSPLDELGDSYLFSAHMVQHLFLTIIGPPLLLLGTPAWLVKPLLHQRTTFLIARGLTFSPPLYAPYLAAPRIWGISAATDQQLGGLIMWIPGGILYIIIMSILFIRWMQKQEAKQLQEEAEEYNDIVV